MKITCTKTYTDYPFGHRQPKHDGHCAFLHGHNWSFVITFSGERDECGFVFDFGKLKPLKEWLDKMFDHTMLINSDDPELETMQRLDVGKLMDLRIVDDCSCEGIAELVLEHANSRIKFMTAGRVTVTEVTVYEDSKNVATARLED